jgi:hypothetical protein
MDAIWVKNSARAFWLAANQNMDSGPGQFQKLLVPGVVCAAFSAELGIKAMLLPNGSVPRTHNLKKLFLKLPQASQDRIIPQCSDTCEEFLASLGGVANAFEDWRYIYESASPSLDIGFLFEFADAVHVVANGPP